MQPQRESFQHQRAPFFNSLQISAPSPFANSWRNTVNELLASVQLEGDYEQADHNIAALVRQCSESSAASDKAKKLKLKHLGFGKYVDAKGNAFVTKNGALHKVIVNERGRVSHLIDESGKRTHIKHNGKMVTVEQFDNVRVKQHIKNTHSAINQYKSVHKKDLKEWKKLKLARDGAQGKDKAAITRAMNKILVRQRTHIKNVVHHLKQITGKQREAIMTKHGLQNFQHALTSASFNYTKKLI